MEYVFFKRLKDHVYSIFKFLTIFLISFSFHTYSKKVSFFVPADHKSAVKIDSLFNSMEYCKEQLTKIENRVIKEKIIRDDEISIKAEYFKFGLKHKILTLSEILLYCNKLNEMLLVKETYLTTLLSVLEDNSRISCFNFLKSTKKMKEEASLLFREMNSLSYKLKGSVINNSGKDSLEIVDNLDGGLTELLKQDSDSFSYGQEIQVENIQRNDINDSDKVVVLLKTDSLQRNDMLDFMQDNDEYKDMINSMAEFFEDNPSNEQTSVDESKTFEN